MAILARHLKAMLGGHTMSNEAHATQMAAVVGRLFEQHVPAAIKMHFADPESANNGSYDSFDRTTAGVRTRAYEYHHGSQLYFNLRVETVEGAIMVLCDDSFTAEEIAEASRLPLDALLEQSVATTAGPA